MDFENDVHSRSITLGGEDIIRRRRVRAALFSTAFGVLLLGASTGARAAVQAGPRSGTSASRDVLSPASVTDSVRGGEPSSVPPNSSGGRTPSDQSPGHPSPSESSSSTADASSTTAGDSTTIATINRNSTTSDSSPTTPTTPPIRAPRMQLSESPLLFNGNAGPFAHDLDVSFAGGDRGLQTRLSISVRNDPDAQYGLDGCRASYANGSACKLTITYKGNTTALATLVIHNDSNPDDHDVSVALNGTVVPIG